MAKTMLSTTLTADISPSTKAIPLAAVTGITAEETILFVDREAMLVLRNPLQSTVPLVMRGVQGTAATGHSSGKTVYYGPQNAFGLADPSGRIPATPDIYLPLVVIPTGGVWNDDGSGNWQQTNSGSGTLTGPAASATIDFPSIGDAEIAEATFSLPGAVVSDKVAPSWPDGMNAGLVGTMFVSSANTITVRLANLSGSPIDPASATYGAQIVRS